MIFTNITSGGLLASQLVYLDFDGESTSYRGEILTVDEVVVEESGLTQVRIEEITAALNAEFAERGVIFVYERPAFGEYSTVYVGKTDAFADQGSVTGIAETIDEGNVNRSDNAFAIVDASDSNEYIFAVIAHEVGHLLGDSHGGEGIEAYRARYDNTYVSNTTWTLSAGDSAYNTLVLGNGVMRVRGSSFQTRLENTGYEIILQDGVAQSTNVGSEAIQTVSPGGMAVATLVSKGGKQIVSSGGTANNASVFDGGAQVISNSGAAAGTLVSSGGLLSAAANADVNGMTLESGGLAIFDADARLSGTVHVGGSMVLSADSVDTGGATVILDLSERQTADGAMINDITYLANGLDAIRTSGAALAGYYSLADNYTATSSLNIAYQGGTDAAGGFVWLEANGRYSGAAEADNRFILASSGTMLQLFAHERYQLLGNGSIEYIAEDAGYTDLRSGSSTGIYAKLTTDQVYQKTIYGGGLNTAVTGQVTLDVAATLPGYLFGGGSGQNADSTVINLLSGAQSTGYVFAGGRRANVGSTLINATGGSIQNLYGGGRTDAADAVAEVSSAVLNLSSGYATVKSNAYTFGGGMSSASGAESKVTDTTITVDGASLSYLHGGGYATNGTVSAETVSVNILSGALSGYLYGGGLASGSGSVAVVDAVKLVIKDGSFSYIYGGGYAISGGSAIVNTVDITVSGGDFSGTLYGGSQGSGTAAGSATAGTISISVDLTGSNTVNFAEGHGIVSGGNPLSTVTGDTSLTLTGLGSNLTTNNGAYTGWLLASSAYGLDYGNTHTLRFDHFTASDFQAQIRGFNRLELAGDTVVTLGTAVGWTTNMNYFFDLSGRDEALAGEALLTQELGSLNIGADSVFRVELTEDELYGADSGTYRLLDGMSSDWIFGSDCVQLTFGGNSGTMDMNGSLALDGYSFSLNYNRTDGVFQLTWAQA